LSLVLIAATVVAVNPSTTTAYSTVDHQSSSVGDQHQLFQGSSSTTTLSMTVSAAGSSSATTSMTELQAVGTPLSPPPMSTTWAPLPVSRLFVTKIFVHRGAETSKQTVD